MGHTEILEVGNSRSRLIHRTRKRQFQELYESYKTIIASSLVRKGCKHSEAEEFTQEAFTRLMSIDREFAPDYLKTYVYKIAHNLAIDNFRRRNKNPIIEDQQVVDLDRLSLNIEHSPSAEDSVSSKEMLASIEATISSLPRNTRYAFIQYKVRGKSYRDIAKSMRISESMVRKHVLKAIRECYDNLETT